MFYAANYWDYFSFAIFKKKCLFIKWIIKIVKIHKIDHCVFLSFSNKTNEYIFIEILGSGYILKLL